MTSHMRLQALRTDGISYWPAEREIGLRLENHYRHGGIGVGVGRGGYLCTQ